MLRLTLKHRILELYGIGGQFRCAADAGMHPSALSRLVAGRSEPTESQAKALIKTLGVTGRKGRGLFRRHFPEQAA